MKKENFISLIMGTIGGLLFALGMCMCLISEWHTFKPGIILGITGAVILIAMLIIRRKLKGLPPIKISGRVIAAVITGVIGALVLGVGMCMSMVWTGMMIQGIIIGILGIVILIFLVPICKGIK